MGQLLVRNVEAATVAKLKARARFHGVSAEEEHRRILREALAQEPERKPSLIEFLTAQPVHPEVELDLSRSKEAESRETGF